MIEIVKAKENDLETVREITQNTIREIYPKYYPSGAVQFFCDHHRDENIINDLKEGIVYLLKKDDEYVGTVTIKGNEINRLFVLPEHQHKGYGKMLLDFAEESILKDYSTIEMDASFPAKKIYRIRGYEEIEYNIIETGYGDYLCYDVMRKGDRYE